MAAKNPTHGERAVSLNLPAEHIPILRDRLSSWLAGIRDDLNAPERLENPDEARREAQAYEQLLVGFTTGQSILPDEPARTAIEAAMEAHDRESNYAEVCRQPRRAARPPHGADGGGELMRRSGDGLRRSPSLSAMTDEEMQRVILGVVLREYPVLLTYPAIRIRGRPPLK